MQVPRAGTGARELHLLWLCELIPCEPSRGFHRYPQTPFPQVLPAWGAEQEAQAVPSCHPHQPDAGTDGWSGDPVAQPPRLQRGVLGVQLALAAARSSPRVVFHGMAAGPAPQQSVHWAEGLSPKLTHGRLVLFHPSLGEQGLAKNPSLIPAGARHLWKYLYFNPYTRPTCNQSNTNSPCFPCKLKTPIRQISKDVSRLIIIHDILPR